MSKKQNLTQLMRECDDQAASYWKQAARDRDKGYEEWMKKVRKVSHFIDVFKKKDSNVDL
jgi:hypothetical protein